ncbi:MAG: ribonuclease H-like domain-containing protein [Clostridiales bacterium]|nr:ribonuclease H-like domain-containing protein [Clostridiales bacterium]
MDKYESKAFDLYFSGCTLCVLDIETTGLAPETSHFVLGSLIEIKAGGEAHLKQYFAEGIAEERQLLAEYMGEASGYDVLLTYNGRRFDVPFLASRACGLDLDCPDMPYNFDLYQVLNGYTALRKLLPNLQQKTVEDFMGLWPYRKDTITGRESAMLYQKYLYLKEIYEDPAECMALMLLHNKDDVLQLSKLLPVLEKADLHKAMHNLGIPIASNGASLTAEKIRLEKNCLSVSGKQVKKPMDLVSYGQGGGDCTIRFEKKRSAFEVSFPLQKKSGLAIIDLRELPFDVCGSMEGSPGCDSGYLVASDSHGVNYRDVNSFIKAFLTNILQNYQDSREGSV